MKYIKYLLLVLLGLAILLLAVGYALSPKFTVSRSVLIQAPPDKIYALIADPRQWKHWSVWNRRDPAMQIEYSGPASGSGAVWAWQSKSQGDGRMSFTTAEPDRRLGYELFFPDFGTTSTGELRLEAGSAGTQVSWVMNGDMGGNPLYHWFAFFGDRMIGPDFEAGLANLKQLAERP